MLGLKNMNLGILNKLRLILKEESFIRRNYREIKSLYYSMRERKFMSKGLSQVYHINLPKEKSELLLITVAYNNTFVISHQLRLLPKYIDDKFHHIVIDNSSNKLARNEILRICSQMDTGYVSLPYNFYFRNSNSHGIALNWACKHLIKVLNPTYIGFLDHDIYPIRKQQLLPILKRQLLFGKQEKIEDIWYLWPGFCFFYNGFLKERNIDFKPGSIGKTGVDTGGLLFSLFLNKVDITELIFPVTHFGNIRKGNVIESDMIEFININNQDCWLHSINAGYWKEVKPKEEILVSILNQY